MNNRSHKKNQVQATTVASSGATARDADLGDITPIQNRYQNLKDLADQIVALSQTFPSRDEINDQDWVTLFNIHQLMRHDLTKSNLDDQVKSMFHLAESMGITEQDLEKAMNHVEKLYQLKNMITLLGDTYRKDHAKATGKPLEGSADDLIPLYASLLPADLEGLDQLTQWGQRFQNILETVQNNSTAMSLDRENTEELNYYFSFFYAAPQAKKLDLESPQPDLTADIFDALKLIPVDEGQKPIGIPTLELESDFIKIKKLTPLMGGLTYTTALPELYGYFKNVYDAIERADFKATLLALNELGINGKPLVPGSKIKLAILPDPVFAESVFYAIQNAPAQYQQKLVKGLEIFKALLIEPKSETLLDQPVISPMYEVTDTDESELDFKEEISTTDDGATKRQIFQQEFDPENVSRKDLKDIAQFQESLFSGFEESLSKGSDLLHKEDIQECLNFQGLLANRIKNIEKNYYDEAIHYFKSFSRDEIASLEKRYDAIFLHSPNDDLSAAQVHRNASADAEVKARNEAKQLASDLRILANQIVTLHSKDETFENKQEERELLAEINLKVSAAGCQLYKTAYLDKKLALKPQDERLREKGSVISTLQKALEKTNNPRDKATERLQNFEASFENNKNDIVKHRHQMSRFFSFIKRLLSWALPVRMGASHGSMFVNFVKKGQVDIPQLAPDVETKFKKK